MSIYPISNSPAFNTFDTNRARNDVFRDENIVRLIASFLDRAQDRTSFGRVNQYVYSIILDPSTLPSLGRFFHSFAAWQRNNPRPYHAGLHGILPPLVTLGTLGPLTSQTSGLLSPSTPPSETISIVTQLAGPVFESIVPNQISFLSFPDSPFPSLSLPAPSTRPYVLFGSFYEPSEPTSSQTRRSPSVVTFPTHSAGMSVINRGGLSSIGRISNRSSPQHPMRPTSSSTEEDFYTNFVESTNNLRHETALQNNTDGGNYLKSVIDERMQTLSDDERVEFKKKIEEIDEELFTVIPNLAVKKAISSTVPLTTNNTPNFMHNHLKQLEQLRQKQKSLIAADLMKECGRIATELQRETDCIASMQKALQSFT